MRKVSLSGKLTIGISRAISLYLLSLFFVLPVVMGETENYDGLSISPHQLVYTPQEMLSFNIEEYLENHAPQLVDFAEIISHWSGYSSISPKIIITIIEHQTGLLTNFDASSLEKPLGKLSTQNGFSNQVKDVAIRIADSYYQSRNNSTVTVESIMQNILSLNTGEMRKSPKSFETTYFTLFPGEVERSVGQSGIQADEGPQQIPPDNLLQLPYPVGESWRFGGSHVSSGSGIHPQASLDFFTGSGGWGSNTSPYWVSSATAGTAIRHSSCSVEVIHPLAEWSTSYYHLDNVQVTTNQSVAINTPLANYANTEAQALCNGGSSTGPHLHFSLKQNGAYYHLDGVKLSGYSVHTGRYSYDTDCNHFWIDDDGSKICAWNNLYNPGVSSTPSVPSYTSATDGKYSDKVVVSWGGVSGATSYKAFRCTSTSTGSCSEIYSGTSTSFNDTTAVLETVYYYRAQACSTECSDFSNYNTGYRSMSVQNQFPWNLFLPSLVTGNR